ncbi:hypothetical protein Q3G72_016721 [Acer saccharum]|nr:hypothetical protein Q3G72_016721 [Acer saccharum]
MLIDEISKQLDAIAIDQNAFVYVAGFSDHPDHRQDPSNGSHVKKPLLGLLDASKNLAERRYLSLISDSYSTVVLDILSRLANGAPARTEKQHAELKTKAAVVITRRLAEGGSSIQG